MSRLTGKRYFLYILWSQSSHRFYIGITENVEKRFKQHNDGISKWTAKFRPWTIALVEAYPDYTDARKREILLKKQKGGNGFYRLTGPKPGFVPVGANHPHLSRRFVGS